MLQLELAGEGVLGRERLARRSHPPRLQGRWPVPLGEPPHALCPLPPGECNPQRTANLLTSLTQVSESNGEPVVLLPDLVFLEGARQSSIFQVRSSYSEMSIACMQRAPLQECAWQFCVGVRLFRCSVDNCFQNGTGVLISVTVLVSALCDLG